MKLVTYYSENYAGIIDAGLYTHSIIFICIKAAQMNVWAQIHAGYFIPNHRILTWVCIDAGIPKTGL